jgi:hypothetical protein
MPAASRSTRAAGHSAGEHVETGPGIHDVRLEDDDRLGKQLDPPGDDQLVRRLRPPARPPQTGMHDRSADRGEDGPGRDVIQLTAHQDRQDALDRRCLAAGHRGVEYAQTRTRAGLGEPNRDIGADRAHVDVQRIVPGGGEEPARPWPRPPRPASRAVTAMITSAPPTAPRVSSAARPLVSTSICALPGLRLYRTTSNLHQVHRHRTTHDPRPTTATVITTMHRSD